MYNAGGVNQSTTIAPQPDATTAQTNGPDQTTQSSGSGKPMPADNGKALHSKIMSFSVTGIAPVSFCYQSKDLIFILCR